MFNETKDWTLQFCWIMSKIECSFQICSLLKNNSWKRQSNYQLKNTGNQKSFRNKITFTTLTFTNVSAQFTGRYLKVFSFRKTISFVLISRWWESSRIIAYYFFNLLFKVCFSVFSPLSFALMEFYFFAYGRSVFWVFQFKPT